MRKRRTTPMPEQFEFLAQYNTERARGVRHGRVHDERMRELQAEFDKWQRDEARASGFEVLDG